MPNRFIEHSSVWAEDDLGVENQDHEGCENKTQGGFVHVENGPLCVPPPYLHLNTVEGCGVRDNQGTIRQRLNRSNSGTMG